MARHVLTLIAAVAFLSGCSGGGSLEVLRGNYAYGRGDYQSALVRYMVALDRSPENGRIEFNMADVYYALGEPEAALETWYQARQHAGSEGGDAGGQSALVFAASYNRGVLLYELGNFAEAYDEFRYALSVNGGSMRAKTNLELTLQKLRAAETASESGGTSGSEGETHEGSQESLRILEYVRRKEAQEWYANREASTEQRADDW